MLFQKRVWKIVKKAPRRIWLEDIPSTTLCITKVKNRKENKDRISQGNSILRERLIPIAIGNCLSPFLSRKIHWDKKERVAKARPAAVIQRRGTPK